jgi:hypothetical protein
MILNDARRAPDSDSVSAMVAVVIDEHAGRAIKIISVRVERYELATDSGGPGTFRGGLGVRRQWRILADESIVNLRMDRFKFSSPGICAAKPARASKAVLNPGSAAERPLTSKVAGLRVRQGDPVRGIRRWWRGAAPTSAIRARARGCHAGYVSRPCTRRL